MNTMSFVRKLFRIVFWIIIVPLTIVFLPLVATVFVTNMAFENDWDAPEIIALVVVGTAISVVWVISVLSLLPQ